MKKIFSAILLLPTCFLIYHLFLKSQNFKTVSINELPFGKKRPFNRLNGLSKEDPWHPSFDISYDPDNDDKNSTLLVLRNKSTEKEVRINTVDSFGRLIYGHSHLYGRYDLDENYSVINAGEFLFVIDKAQLKVCGTRIRKSPNAFQFIEPDGYGNAVIREQFLAGPTNMDYLFEGYEEGYKILKPKEFCH